MRIDFREGMNDKLKSNEIPTSGHEFDARLSHLGLPETITFPWILVLKFTT